MIHFEDEEPEAKEEREAHERQHPHVLRLTDGERDVALQLATYARQRLTIGSARASAMEQIDLVSFGQKLEAS